MNIKYYTNENTNISIFDSDRDPHFMCIQTQPEKKDKAHSGTNLLSHKYK
jgi:hypothetical protein